MGLKSSGQGILDSSKWAIIIKVKTVIRYVQLVVSSVMKMEK